MISRKVPFSFISTRYPLSWEALILGLQEGWLDQNEILENLSLFDIPSDKRPLLESYSRAEAIDLLKKSEISDSTKTSEARLSWLRILMAWTFYHRNDLSDPLYCVEQLYADFDYPDEIHEIVRFNTPRDGHRPQDHTPEENSDRLMKLWENYYEYHMNLPNKAD